MPALKKPARPCLEKNRRKEALGEVMRAVLSVWTWIRKRRIAGARGGFKRRRLVFGRNPGEMLPPYDPQSQDLSQTIQPGRGRHGVSPGGFDARICRRNR